MTGVNMDRRQKRTRKAIFIAFNELLSNKAYDKITVQEIISVKYTSRSHQGKGYVKAYGNDRLQGCKPQDCCHESTETYH